MVAASVSTGTVLWEWTFQALPAGWTVNEYWEFTDTGAHSYVSATTSGPYSVSQYAELVSPVYTVPAGVTHLLVTVTSEWNLSGWCASGESNCYIWARIDTSEDWYSVEFDSKSWGFDQSVSYPGTDTVAIYISEGTKFTLLLKSGASSSYGASATADWMVHQITITDQDGTALSRNTWGAIKSSFWNCSGV